MKSSKAVKTFLAVLLPTLLFLKPCLAVDSQRATVEKALTGDSLLLKGGKTLRYIGLEAYPMQSKVVLIREYGEKARLFNESLVGGKEIRIEWDSKIRDERNNLLAYVYLEDGRFVNLEILKAGHAKTRIRAPNWWRSNWLGRKKNA